MDTIDAGETDTKAVVSRQALLDGSFLRSLRESPPKGVVFKTDEELESSLSNVLANWDAGTDLFVFAYGSLMWNPSLRFEDMVAARVTGWSRRFCLWLYAARGSEQRPGLMLALHRGGSCKGLLLRVAGSNVHEEMALLWRREMLSDSYQARWVRATLAAEPRKSVLALTFVINPSTARYVPSLDPDQVAHFISTGAGKLGTCLDYFDAMVAKLAALRIKDAAVERIRAALAKRDGLTRGSTDDIQSLHLARHLKQETK